MMNNRLQERFVLALDFAAVIISYGLTNLIRYGAAFGKGFNADTLTILLLILFFHLLIYALRPARTDFFSRTIPEELWFTAKRLIAVVLIITAWLFFLKIPVNFSRVYLTILMVCSYCLISLFRVLLKLFFIHGYRKMDSNSKLVIVTTSFMAEEISRRMKDPSNELWHYQMVGWILVDEEKDVVGKILGGYPVIGNFDTMFTCVTREAVDEVFIHVPYSRGLHVAHVIEEYEDMGITVNLNINVFDLELRHRQKELRSLGGFYVISFRQTVTTIQMAFIKRPMDIAGGLVGLLITGIATIFVAPFLLLESPGPLFFSQIRVGRNGRRFKIYKFRSMYKDAEERKKELMKQNEMKGLMFKMENDPRITKVGRFIRKYSIDELPQFWNVLKGDMSLVGTRPPTLDEFLQYESRYKRRLSIKPGITGLWQVSGRSDIKDFEDVLALDLEYIDNWSLSLDIKLLFKTVYVAFFGKGAK